MKRDMARVYTDRKLNELTKELERVYSRALDETQAKWNEYAASHEARANELYNKWQKYKQQGKTEQAADAKAKYQRYLRKTAFGNKKWKQTVEDISKNLAQIDKASYQLANNILPDVYAANYNAISSNAVPMGYAFHIVDARTVTNLATRDIQLLIDTRWNRRRLNAEILQGIIKGEPMSAIAKRLMPYVENNKVAAIRNARTAVTSAENKGRYDSMIDANADGIVVIKEWISTEDSRTRESHKEINGEVKLVDQAFTNGLMYPADPSGDGAEVYNCRCTMGEIIVGFRRKDGSIEYTNEGELYRGMF